jgi:hypothetical protein
VVLLCNRQHMHVALNMDVATKSIWALQANVGIDDAIVTL